MLRSIILYKLRNSEFIQFFTDLFSIILKFNPTELGVKGQLDPIIKEHESIEKIHATNKGSDISPELKLIDDERDDCITGISAIAEAYTHHYDDETKAAAELIINKISLFGPSIAKQNYPAETTSINGFVGAIKSEPKLAAAVEKLHLTDWAGRLELKNNLFSQRYLERIDEASQQSEETIKELRKTTMNNYYELRKHLNSHFTLEKAKYQPVIDQLNQLIDKYNGIIKRRKGGKNGEDSEG